MCALNRHVQELSAFYASLMRDCASAYPALEAEFEKDLNRLLALVKSRGIRVFLEDLPAVGKHLDRCLDNGKYELSGLPLTKRFSGRVVIPKFLRGLYLLVFHECGSLRTDCDIQAIVLLRQVLLGGKKATVPCSDEKVSLEVASFFEVDQSLPTPEWFWDEGSSDTQQPSKEVEAAEEAVYCGYSKSSLYAARVSDLDPRKRARLSACLGTLDKISSILATTLGSYDPRDWKHKHGPGAVSEVTGPSNKYYWTNWTDRLELEYPIADCGFHSLSSWADRCRQDDCIGSYEPHSRLVAVPKSFSKPRLIAAEPSQNQWCQQNLLAYFSERSRATWIGSFVRFNDQTPNQELCKAGARTGTLATVDLSAASDRVSCHFVGQLFRSNPKVLRSLRASRTRLCRQLLTRSVPELMTLKKFSTMGNACTFPVESFGFLCVALACVLTERRLPVTLGAIRSLIGSVAVFGDDIVIPTECRELFVDALEVLHFKVNTNKSFFGENFRESCGVDSFRGVDVTPVYWKTFYDGGPESLESVIGTVNNLYKRWLMNASARLSWTLPLSQLAMVDTRSGVTGIQSRSGLDNRHLQRRWNQDLQREEVRVRCLRAKQDRTATNDDTALLQYFTEAPEPTTRWSHGIAQRPQLKNRLGWVSVHSLYAQ